MQGDTYGEQVVEHWRKPTQSQRSLMNLGKCLTVTETGISSAHKIRPSFPWETEGRTSQHTDKHKVHNASNSRLPLSCTHKYSDPQAGGWMESPHQALQYLVESNMGAWWWCHLVNLTQESKISNVAAKTVQRHPQLMKLHHSVIIFLLARSTSLQTMLTKTTLCTPQVYSERSPGIHFAPSGIMSTTVDNKQLLALSALW